MEHEFLNKKPYFMSIDKSILDIEIIGVFGGGWRGGSQEMILRIIYKGGKRLFTTVHASTFKDELSQLIYKTRTMYREQKLERILDGE